MAEYSKGLGQLLSDSFMLFFKNFDRIVTVVAAVHLPLAVLHVIFFTNVDVEHILASQRVVAMVPFFARSILYVAITLTGVLLYHVALIKTIESIDTNAPLELANAYRQARTLLLPYMLVWFLGIVRIAGWFCFWLRRECYLPSTIRVRIWH